MLSLFLRIVAVGVLSRCYFIYRLHASLERFGLSCVIKVMTAPQQRVRLQAKEKEGD